MSLIHRDWRTLSLKKKKRARGDLAVRAGADTRHTFERQPQSRLGGKPKELARTNVPMTEFAPAEEIFACTCTAITPDDYAVFSTPVATQLCAR